MPLSAALKKQIDSVRHSPWGFLVERWRLTLVALIAIVFAGIIGLVSMPLESDPEVKIPIGLVTVPFPGASPSDVEELVTDKMETELKTLDNIKLLTSTSSEGISSLVVEFEASADITESIRKLRDKVSEAKSSLPTEAEDPIVTEIRTNDVPIITFSLIGNLTPFEFKTYGEDLQDKLEGIYGVSKATLSGIEDKEVQVLVDVNALEGYKLSLSQVVNAIQTNHVDFPIGNILTQGFYYQISLKGQLETAEDIQNLPIANRNGRNIFLKDVATVREVFSERRTITRNYDVDSKEYRSSITLQVFKKTGANLIEIDDAAKAEVERYKEENLPPSVDVRITGDNSEFVREDIGTLSQSGLQSITMIFFLLFIALGAKEAILAAISIPLIFFISFLTLYLSGETFNFLVLFSLILSVGLIVDTSIVMMEGVHDNLKNKKMKSSDAAYMAIRMYRNPLIASTLTTISAFIPMALMPGIIGQYMSHIPRTVTITLAASLIVATIILPGMASHLFRNYDPKKTKEPLMSRFMKPAQNWYEKKIRHVLESKMKRRLWVFGMIMASFAAISLPFIGVMKIQMWPKWDGDYFTVSIEGPAGSTLEDTLKLTESVEKKIEGLPELDNFVTIVGGNAIAITSDGPGASLGGATSFNRASITVNLLKKKFRTMKAFEVSEILRNDVRSITGATITVEDLQTGPPSGSDVEVRLTGKNNANLQTAAKIVENELASIEGARDTDSDVERGTGEFHFNLKRDRLEFYGISALQVASELRTAVFGNSSVKIIKEGDETPIVVRLDFRDPACSGDPKNILLERRDQVTLCRINPENIDQLNRLLINTPKGQVPVSELISVSINPSISTIRHRDSERIVNVRAYAKEGFIAEDIRQSLQEKISGTDLPDGVTVDFGGEFEEQQESFNSLWKAMYVGLILIVFILVLQFNSFRQPFIIIFTLPLALIGVFFGLAAVGRNFSFPGFIGIVALMGVVVNDAIVLIDQINNNVRDGMKKVAAITQAGKDRLQPIFLTTITTATGVLPLVFASSFWTDLALSIFFGILFATVLTLVMVPIFYNALENKKELDEVMHSGK